MSVSQVVVTVKAPDARIVSALIDTMAMAASIRRDIEKADFTKRERKKYCRILGHIAAGVCDLLLLLDRDERSH